MYVRMYPKTKTGWELRTIDTQIEELLQSDISCSIALPRLPKRVALEDSKLLKGTRISVLDEDWDVGFFARCFPPRPHVFSDKLVSCGGGPDIGSRQRLCERHGPVFSLTMSGE